MRKKLAFALAMMMILTSLAACGGKDNGASSEKADGSVSAMSGDLDGTVSTPIKPDSSAQPDEPKGEQDPEASATETPADAQQESKPQQSTGGSTAGASKPQQNKPAEKPSKPVEKPAEPKPDPVPELPAAKTPAVADVAAAVESALATEIAFMELTADDLTALYGLDASAVEAFTCKMPMMNVQATEFFVAKAAAGQVETVKAAAVKRQADLDATWSHYLPAQYELVQNYKLVVNGDYVLFVVAENAQAAVDAFNSLTK